MKSVPGSNSRADWPLAVIFGAGGLGIAVARRLGLSHRLLIVDRDCAHLDRQIKALDMAGYDARGQECDVTNTDDIARLASAAGDIGLIKSLAFVVGLSPSLGDFRQIMSVNLLAPAIAVDALRDCMAPAGAALCIASSAAHMQDAPEELATSLDDPLTDEFFAGIEAALGDRADPATAYMLSKKGLVRLCQRKAREWGEKGLRINSLSPGLIATPQGAGEYANSPSKLKLFEAIPLEREATMLEIADIAEFLLSDRASYISGTDLLVDGGLIGGLGCRKFS